MDKNELIEKIAGNTGLTKKDVGIVINTFIVTVTKALVEGSKVQLLGFGVFGTRERNARKVRNPRTGEYRSCSFHCSLFQARKNFKRRCKIHKSSHIKKLAYNKYPPAKPGVFHMWA